MCVVVPLAATIAMGVASTAASYIGQQQQANQQRAYQNQVYEQQSQQAIAEAEYQNRQVTRNNEYIRRNAENARIALATDRQALVRQDRQESLATALDIEQKRIERLKAVGAIQASERAGLSLEGLMSDFYRQEARYVSVAQQNLAFSSAQRQLEGQKLVSTTNSRLNEARPYEAAPFQSPNLPAPVQSPSLLGAVLGAGSTVAGQLNSRSVYDPSRGRYVIGTQRALPTSLPSYSSSAPRRSYTTGFSSQKTGLK